MKQFVERKIVVTRKDHFCDVCGETIPKGTKCLNEHGYDEFEGYFNVYIHLDKKHKCYLTYMDALFPLDPDTQQMILSNVEEAV